MEYTLCRRRSHLLSRFFVSRASSRTAAPQVDGGRWRQQAWGLWLRTVFLDAPGAMPSGGLGGSKRHKQGSCRIGQEKALCLPVVALRASLVPPAKHRPCKARKQASGLARPSRSPGPSFDERRFGSGKKSPAIVCCALGGRIQRLVPALLVNTQAIARGRN